MSDLKEESMDRGVPSIGGSQVSKNIIYVVFFAAAVGLIFYSTVHKTKDSIALNKSNEIDEQYGTGVSKLPNYNKSETPQNGEIYKGYIKRGEKAVNSNSGFVREAEAYQGESSGVITELGKSPYEENGGYKGESRERSVNNGSSHNSGGYVSSRSGNSVNSRDSEEKWKRRQANPLLYEVGMRQGSNPETSVNEYDQLNKELEKLTGSNGANAMRTDLMTALKSGMPSMEKNDPNSEFLEKLKNKDVETAMAMPLGEMQYKIIQGKVISGTLETAIDSSLPGMVRAIVSNDIYGEKGREVLIPRGSRIIGQYNSAIQQGQYRIFIVWTRLIRPEGVDINITSTGTDSLGRSGSAGEVDSKFWTRFGNATLLSMLGAGTANYGANDDVINPSDAYRNAISRSFTDQASAELGKAVNIPDTIHIDQGTKIKIMVAKDLDFSIVMKSGMQGVK